VIGADFTPNVFMGAGRACAEAGFTLDFALGWALADFVCAWAEGAKARTNASSEIAPDRVPRAE
jgi:hypothetical protein